MNACQYQLFSSSSLRLCTSYQYSSSVSFWKALWTCPFFLGTAEIPKTFTSGRLRQFPFILWSDPTVRLRMICGIRDSHTTIPKPSKYVSSLFVMGFQPAFHACQELIGKRAAMCKEKRNRFRLRHSPSFTAIHPHSSVISTSPLERRFFISSCDRSMCPSRVYAQELDP